MVDYQILLKLTSFNNAIITREEINGIEEEGVFIPLKYNSIFRTRGGEIAVNLYAKEKKPNAYGQSHVISNKMSKKKYLELKELGFETAFIGNMKIVRNSGYNYLKTPNKVSLDEALER